MEPLFVGANDSPTKGVLVTLRCSSLCPPDFVKCSHQFLQVLWSLLLPLGFVVFGLPHTKEMLLLPPSDQSARLSSSSR